MTPCLSPETENVFARASARSTSRRQPFYGAEEVLEILLERGGATVEADRVGAILDARPAAGYVPVRVDARRSLTRLLSGAAAQAALASGATEIHPSHVLEALVRSDVSVARGNDRPSRIVFATGRRRRPRMVPPRLLRAPFPVAPARALRAFDPFAGAGALVDRPDLTRRILESHASRERGGRRRNPAPVGARWCTLRSGTPPNTGFPARWPVAGSSSSIRWS